MHPDTRFFLNSLPDSWRAIAEAQIRKQAIQNKVDLKFVKIKTVRVKSSLEAIEISLDLIIDRPIDTIHIADTLRI